MRTSSRRCAVSSFAALLLALPAVAAAQASPGMLVSAEWVATHLDDPEVVVLDAEERVASYDGGHIPGARLLDMKGLMWEGDPPVGAEMRSPAAMDSAFEAAGVSDGQRIVVYGSSPLMAARAWVTLDVMGLGDRASVLDGGLAAWKRHGRAVSTEAPPVAAGTLTPHPRSGLVVDSDWVLHHLGDPALTILDARGEAEYTGADGGAEGGKLHAGHVPGAYHLDWHTLIESGALPELRPRRELDSLVSASGAAPGSMVVTYCQTGVRGSFDYFVARLLGYDARLYDGSWHDWGSKDLPYVAGKSRR